VLLSQLSVSTLKRDQSGIQSLARLAAAKCNRRIAEDLVLDVRTVDNHVRNLYAKLGVHDRAQAALSAARLGLITMSGSQAGAQ
jgi:DNA-binding NarL/FixJ family response regulator